MVFSFTHADVVDALVRAQARGVDVVGIFDESQAHGAWSADETLAAAGVPVLIDGNGNASGFSGGKLHHKVLVVDPGQPGARTISGSMNWSNAGTSDNDENLVLIESPSVAADMMTELCTLLADATPHPDATAEVPDVCDLPPEEDPGPGGVVINEVMARPDAHDRDGGFVELVSVLDDDLDLTGWQLTGPDAQVVHTFTHGKLAAGRALVLAARDSALQGAHVVEAAGSLHLPTAWTLQLRAPTGEVVDRFDLADTRPGESLARLLDGRSDTPPTAHADLTMAGRLDSPGRRADGRPWSHDPGSPQLVINEVLPDPDGTDSGEEYVELVNAGALPLDPTGYTLCDASDVCHTFGPPVLLPGEAMVLFDHGDHTDTPGARTSSAGRLSLNNSGDTLTLWAPDGSAHGTVTWSGSSAGVAWNRSSDADPTAPLVRHDHVDGAAGVQSPGLRAAGTPWR